mmetsp:Transcript_142423/g.455200  ORF Transcript_142423/g.455200 Transcript_142423/m.455200 type:complete len:263 (-) Transcript_142423:502-1290(-)
MVFTGANSGHFLVQAGRDARVVRGPPVRLHKSLETHALLQHLELLRIAATVLAADLIVGAHHRGDAGIHGSLVRRVVQLPRNLVVHDGRLSVTIGLLLVEHPMLHHCEDTFRLHSLHVALHQLRTKVRVLAGQVLEVAAVASHSVHVDRGPQDGIGTLASELAAQRLAVAPDGLRVPRRRHAQHRGPDRGLAGHAGGRGSEAGPSILHVETRQIQARYGISVPHVPILPLRVPSVPRLVITVPLQKGQLLTLRYHAQRDVGA